MKLPKTKRGWAGLGCVSIIALVVLCSVLGTVTGTRPPSAAQPAAPAAVSAATEAPVDTAVIATTSVPAAIVAPTNVPPTIEPTAIPSTAEPTSEPTLVPRTSEPTTVPPTNTPAPATADAERSGGLGLSRTTWEVQFGPGTDTNDFIGTVQYGNDTQVNFSQEDHVGTIEQRWTAPITLDVARQEMRRYFPDDAEALRTYQPFADVSYVVDVFESTWLIDRFGDVMIGDSPMSPWINGEPGMFFVIYRVQDGKLTSAILALGDNP